MSKNLSLFGSMFVFACMLLISATFAFDVNEYLYATETSANVQNSTLSVGSISYVLYTISSNNAILLKGETVVQNQDEIATALKSKCFSDSYPSASGLDEIQTLVLKYNESRNGDGGYGPAEFRCMTSTGQTVIDCTDVQSCQGACSSAGVTSGSCGQLMAGYGYGLANALVYYAESRHNMNGNSTLVVNLVSELKAVSSVNQLTFDAYSKIDQLYTATTDMKAAGDSMLANKLFIHYLELGYYICTPIPLDTDSITSAVTDASAIKAEAACFDSLDSSATNLLNNTLDRMDYRLNVRQKEVYQTEFTSLMGEYNLLAENATQILAIFNSSEIDQSMSNIENYSATYYQYTSAQNYEAAGQEVANIRGAIENLKSSIATVNEAYSGIGVARDSASAAIEKLTILVASTDNSLASERNAVINSFNQLEASISSKISSSSAPGFADQYNSIATQANSVINQQKELDAGKVGNIFSDFSRGISLTVLNTISDPLGVREEEKRTWMSIIPTIVISILDILILAIISLGFFVLVWNRTKDFLKSKVIRTWAIIFVFIVVLLLGLSYALNSLIVAAIGPTSYFDFMTHLSTSDSAYIFVEYSSSTDSTPISNCASRIESALTASGKAATIVNVVDGVCKDALYSECLLQVGSTPIINLKYAKTNSTAFYTFYKIESDISGDDSYFDECTFAKLLS